MTATDSFDADRLDAWLEGNPFPSASLNGHSDAQSDLVGTAQRFHAGIGAAERGVPVPARAIWEDVMQRTADLKISSPVIAATNGSGVPRTPVASRRPTMESPHRRGYWFTTASLIVIAVFAIVAVAFLANRPSNGGDEVPGLGISAFTPIAGSSVIASPAADDPAAMPFTILDPEKIDCSEVVRRSNEEIAALQTNPGEFPNRSYGPAVPADPEHASLVSVTDQYVNACRSEWRTLASPRLIADVQGTGYPAGLFPGYYLDQGMTMAELPAFLQGLLDATGITEVAQVIAPTGALGDDAVWMRVVNPNHVFLFPDGRLGAVQTTLMAAETEQLVMERGAIESMFVFYIQDPTQDGKWVLDETMPICIGECDEYWAGMAEGSWYEQILQPIPGSTPDATPAADMENIERWLVPPSSVDCGTPVANDINSNEWSTDTVIDTNAYLPFSEPSMTEQEAIAQTVLFTMSDCVNSTMLSDDFAWMAGAPGDLPTADQIIAAKEISEALPDQDPTNYLIVVPSDDPDYRGRQVVLPQDVVMLADGRLGAPTRTLATSEVDADLVRQMMGNGTFTLSLFYTFERSGDNWLLDEIFQICIGECDAAWTAMANGTDLEGTPVSLIADTTDPPSQYVEEWVAAADAYACPPVTTDAQGTATSRSWPTDLVIEPNSYLPFTSPSGVDRDDLSTILLQMIAGCEARPSFSPDFAWMPGPSVAIPTDDQIVAAKEISAALPDQNPESYFQVVSSADIPEEQGDGLFLPTDILQLADGRLGVPVRFMVASEKDAEWMLDEAARLTGGDRFAMTAFYTFTELDSDWVVDEMFLICVGECDAAWEAMANGTGFDGTPIAPEPDATPVTAADFPPITAEECKIEGLTSDEVSAIARDPGDEPERSYEPVHPSDPANVFLAAQADRAWLACTAYGSIGQKTALQTPWFTHTGPNRDVLSRNGTIDEAEAAVEQRADLVDAMLTTDPLDFTISADQTTDEILASFGSVFTEYPYGARAVELDDGRIAIPQMTLVASDAYDTFIESREQFAYFTVPVHIMALNPETHLWQVDEVTWVCGGDCDQMVIDLSDQVAPTQDQSSQEPSTLAATPATITNTASDESAWLIDPESISCNRANGEWTGTNAIGIPGSLDDYVPFELATTYDQTEIARTFQLIDGRCYGEIDQTYFADTFWSFPLRPDNLPVEQDQLNIVRAISESINTGDAMDFIHATDASIELTEPWVSHFALLPSTVVELPDGRLGAPLQIVFEANSPDELDQWIAETGGLVVSRFVVFARVDDGYVMEATIPICLGGCEDYWSGYVIADTASMSTPAAMASPAAELAYRPITAEECNVVGLSADEVSAIIRDPGEEPERSYVPVGPADAADAEAAIAADRAWQACSAYGSIGQKTVLQTPWLTATGPDPDLNWLPSNEIESMVTERRALSDAMLSDDPFDYLISSGQTQEEMIANLTAPSFTIPASGGAFELEDGRIAIPQIRVLAEDSYQFTDDWSPTFDYFTLPVHIMAQDPATGGWLVDEVTWLCAGDCDQLIVNVQSYEDAILEQSGQEPATPQATPAAGS